MTSLRYIRDVHYFVEMAVVVMDTTNVLGRILTIRKCVHFKNRNRFHRYILIYGSTEMARAKRAWGSSLPLCLISRTTTLLSSFAFCFSPISALLKLLLCTKQCRSSAVYVLGSSKWGIKGSITVSLSPTMLQIQNVQLRFHSFLYMTSVANRSQLIILRTSCRMFVHWSVQPGTKNSWFVSTSRNISPFNMPVYDPNSSHLQELLIFRFNMNKFAAEARWVLSAPYEENASRKKTCCGWFHSFNNAYSKT